MISDSLLVYLLFQIIILVFNLIGFTRIPMMFFFALIGTIILAVPTIQAFGDYYMMAVFLLIVNISLPVVGLARSLK
jgi:hypothetical protein